MCLKDGLQNDITRQNIPAIQMNVYMRLVIYELQQFHTSANVVRSFCEVTLDGVTRVFDDLHLNFELGDLLSGRIMLLSQISQLTTQLFHTLVVRCSTVLRQTTLTLSSPVMPNGYTSGFSGPYWSNPPLLIFWHSGTLALSPERQSARMSKKLKTVG